MQTVAHTAVPPTTFMKLASMNPGEILDIKTFHDGINYDTSVNLKAGEWHDATASGFLTPDTTTSLVNYILGATDTITGAADPYLHSGNAAQVYPRLLSFEQAFGNQNQLIDRSMDGYLKEVKIAAKAGEWGKVDLGYMATNTQFQTTPATVTFDPDRELTFIDATLTISGLNVAITDVTEFTADIKMNIFKTQVVGAATPVLTSGVRDIQLDLQALMPNNQAYRQIFYGTVTGTAPAPAPTVMTTFVANFALVGPPAHNFQLTLNNVAMTAAKPSFDVSGKPLILAMTGMAQLKASTPAVAYSAANARMSAY